MLTALDHVILAVHDLDAARERYQGLLGLSPSWTGEHPEAGTANVLFRVDNTYLELLAPAGDGPARGLLEAWLALRGEGLLGLAFATDDAEACRAALEARGLAPGPVEDGHGRDTISGAQRHWRRLMLPMDRTRGVLLFPIEHTSPAEALPRAKATGEPAASVHALDHAVVQSGNAEATKALYGEGLGLRLALDKEFPDWGMRLMFFRTGGVTVEVAASLGESQDASPTEDRLWGLSWRVGDVDAARARLAAAGFDVSEVRTGRRPGTRVFTVRDGTCGVATLMLEVAPGHR
jgi:catechol 2,3-dioxygenase-like lactoylglutathione lyase family enzyme